jgi:hypothetical protein
MKPLTPKQTMDTFQKWVEELNNHRNMNAYDPTDPGSFYRQFSVAHQAAQIRLLYSIATSLAKLVKR